MIVSLNFNEEFESRSFRDLIMILTLTIAFFLRQQNSNQLISKCRLFACYNVHICTKKIVFQIRLKIK